VKLAVDILGIGLLGPGLADWPSGALLLSEGGGWCHAPTLVPVPLRLPATERRRAGAVVKTAIVVADQACVAAGIAPATLPTVFSSSTGEPANCHALCEALATPDRLVSPTRFTNSVHNAPAGYWHIATQSMQPSTSLCAHDASFGTGLLEAAVQCVHTQAPVLLVACDVPYPEPLHGVRALTDVFGVAFVLAPGTALDLSLDAESAATACTEAGLEQVRVGNPAARALPLLQALAQRRSGRLVIEGPGGLALQVEAVVTHEPATLDHAGIAARIPHSGRMCLLDALLGWNADEIRCRAGNHADAEHPLRCADGLLAANAIEYAAQAMALHAALNAAPGSEPKPGFLAAARQVRLLVPRLDDAPGPLLVHATRQAGGDSQAIYRFALHDAAGRLLVDGRATVVLNTPLVAS